MKSQGSGKPGYLLKISQPAKQDGHPLTGQLDSITHLVAAMSYQWFWGLTLRNVNTVISPISQVKKLRQREFK